MSKFKKYLEVLSEAEAKTYTVKWDRNGKERSTSGTIEELIEYFEYTLETGQSYEHEKGNKKINLKPKTIGDLIKNLNNAINNSANNGYAGYSYYT